MPIIYQTPSSPPHIKFMSYHFIGLTKPLCDEFYYYNFTDRNKKKSQGSGLPKVTLYPRDSWDRNLLCSNFSICVAEVNTSVSFSSTLHVSEMGCPRVQVEVLGCFLEWPVTRCVWIDCGLCYFVP